MPCSKVTRTPRLSLKSKVPSPHSPRLILCMLEGHFVATVSPKDTRDSAPACVPTSRDMLGPFHVAPETVPKNFPQRTISCVPDPVCTSCNDHPGYLGGVPMQITVLVRSTSCSSVPDAVVDVWQADPAGAYWRESDIWSGGRSRRLDDTSHHYNCRAHSAPGTNTYTFTSLLPGYYSLGRDRWRPRHVHIRVRAPGYNTLVSQIYFEGDAVLASERIAKDLIVPLRLQSGDGSTAPFSLDQLSQHASTCATTIGNDPETTSRTVMATTAAAASAGDSGRVVSSIDPYHCCLMCFFAVACMHYVYACMFF